jgi:hypothetical protein
MKQNHIESLNQPLRLPVSSSVKKNLKKLDFEFMDLESLPNSLRSVLRDILEVGNGAPFRNYYQWVAASVYEYAQKNKISEIVELGAGCAPITKHLIKKYPQWEVGFKVTDLNPDVVNFKSLEQTDERVTAVYESLDFTKRIQGYENSLLVLSATFHHVSENQKNKILSNLKALSPHVMIFEPLKPNVSSILFVIGALLSGFLTPLFKINSKKFFRCALWCWVVPIAPFLFLWDGWISAIRCWSKQKWQTQEPKAIVKESLFCTCILVNR